MRSVVDNNDEDLLKTSDTLIQQTNDDATACRVSASMAGYFADEYAQNFGKARQRMPPLINRGTWLRCRAVDSIIAGHLAKYP